MTCIKLCAFIGDETCIRIGSKATGAALWLPGSRCRRRPHPPCCQWAASKWAGPSEFEPGEPGPRFNILHSRLARARVASVLLMLARAQGAILDRG
jgi:hypothetical protein